MRSELANIIYRANNIHFYKVIAILMICSGWANKNNFNGVNTFMLNRMYFKSGANLRFSFLSIFILWTLLCMPFSAIAENSPTQLQSDIKKASNRLNNSRSVSSKLEKRVKKAEDNLHLISKELHSTETKINKLTTNLTKSNAESKKLEVQTDQQKDALAQQMQALYTSGKQSHLRLLLKQDDPSDISRTVKYFEYMNQHRLERIGLIKTRLDKIKTLQNKIQKDSKTLKTLQDKQRGRKSSLKKLVKEKESAYKKQRKVVYTQEQKLAKLQKQEARLQGVIKRLAQKRKQEERQHRQELAKAKAAAAAKRSNSQKQQAKKSTLKASKKTVVAAVQKHYVPNKAFSKLRGKLAWPVRGRLTQAYGSSRNSKQRWKGVIISAAAGTRVHAVARGKVEFSGRLRGYGYLVIIRHDKNYRSLYAYNRSVYKKEGQVVNKGDIIAAVGNSGGQSRSGLYFEIRNGTAPQNPKKWIR